MLPEVLKTANRNHFLCGSLTLLVIVSAFVFGTGNVAYACSCAGTPSVQDALNQNDAVFSGNVTALEKTHPSKSSADPVSVTFSVDRVWKGPENSTITINTVSSEISCGYEFQIGKTYVVYSYEKDKGKPSSLHTGLCSRTTLFSDSYEDLRQLGAGTKIISPEPSVEKPAMEEPDYSRLPYPDPVLDLWMNHAEIIDGTIVSKTTYPSMGEGMTEFHVKINKFFKPLSKNTESITLFASYADSDIPSILDKGDRALIYIEPENQISKYSVKADESTYCEPRDYIQIAPVLPNDPNQLVRGPPTVPFDWKDQCVPDYFDFDPNFWIHREYKPPMQQWRVHDIPMEQQKCAGEGDDYVSVQKHGNSSYKYCVKPETVSTLVGRGWAVTNENEPNTFEFSFCGADGFDSKENLNKGNSTHQWDEDECQWIGMK